MALTLAALITLSVPLLALGAPGGAAAPTPTVVGRVELEAVGPVDVNKDNETAVTGHGLVNVTIPGGLTPEVRVNLSAQVNNTDWVAVIWPDSVSLTGSGEFAFEVNFTVPGRVASNAGATLFVAANVTVVGAPPVISRIYTDSTPVPVVQYFAVALTPATPSSPEAFTAQAGNTTSFSIRLQNLGNGPDSFELTAQNLAQLQGQGIAVSLPSPVSVPKGGLVQVNGNVTLPATLTEGNFTLSIGALSTGAAAKGETVTASADKRFAAAPPPAGGGGGGGGGGPSSGGGFLPGFDAVLAVGAVAGAALGAARRLRRP